MALGLSLAAAFVVDVLCSIAALMIMSALIGVLTFFSTVYARSRSQSLRAEKVQHESHSISSMCVFVLKGYGFALLMGILFHHCGYAASACAGFGLLSVFPGSQDDSVQLFQYTRPEDLLFLCLVLPILCAPIHLSCGFGAAYFVFLCVSYLWATSAKASVEFLVASTLAFCCSCYMAWLLGVLQPLQEIEVVDVSRIAFTIMVLRICPNSINVWIILLTIVWSVSTQESASIMIHNLIQMITRRDHC